jgi:putative ABC transport system permease protein
MWDARFPQADGCFTPCAHAPLLNLTIPVSCIPIPSGTAFALPDARQGRTPMETFLQDLRYAARTLTRTPGFTAIAIATLALGIGATTAIWSLVDAVLLRPLPFTEPERLAAVWMSGGSGGERYPMSVADLRDWRARNRAFARVSAFVETRFALTGAGEPELLSGAWVTSNFFATLGVRSLLGRAPQLEDDRSEADAVVVLSHGLWRRRFGADPRVVGRTISLDGTPCTVLGVMPAEVAFPPGSYGPVEIWTVLKDAPPPRRGPYFLNGVARLAPGVTLEKAQAELAVIGRAVERDNPLSNAGATFAAAPLADDLVGAVRPALLVLLGAVGFVLLIAAANVANLLLVRAAGREREMAVRAALGAGRSRLARQLLTESVLLAAAGAAAGLLLAWWGVELLPRLAPAALPRLDRVALDGRVLGFTVLLTLATGLLFGLAPALQGSRRDLHGGLKEGSRSSESHGRRRLRRLVVASEVAAALVLLVGAGLLLASYWRLQGTSAGIRPEGVWMTQVELPSARYEEDRQVIAFYRELLARIEALPGVRSAGVGISLPPHMLTMTDGFTPEGHTVPPGRSAPLAVLDFVSPGYFQTLGVPLLAGRPFGPADREGAPGVAVVNQTLARRYFPKGAVGRRLKIGGPERPDNPWLEIVGVVADVKYGGLAAPAEPAYYLPTGQLASHGMRLVVRADGGDAAAGLAARVRQTIRGLDRDLPVEAVRPLSGLVAESIAAPRLRTQLIGAFGALALVLAAIGIYGVLAYTVAQRTRELGVRMALGAGRGGVIRLVLGELLGVVLGGLAVGLAAAFALTRLLRGLLFEIAPTDPRIFAGVPLLLAVCALLAAYLPARRAAEVEPVVALRSE